MPSPFYFHIPNYRLAQSTQADSMYFQQMQMRMSSMADSIMYMTPMQTNFVDYTLCDPMRAAQEVFFRSTNAPYVDTFFNSINSNPWANWNYTPWNNTSNNSNNSNSSDSTEYKALKAVIEKYKELYKDDLTTLQEDDIKKALNFKGTSEERLNALKDVYKTINKRKLEKTLLELPEYKLMLTQAGYNFKGTNKKNDKELRNQLTEVEKDIKSGGKKGELALLMNGEKAPEILRALSYWNDKHSSEEERSIIRLLANHVPSAEDEKTQHIEGLDALVTALIEKANDFVSDADGSFPLLDSTTQKVTNALAKAKKNYDKANLKALAKPFEDLYAMLRVLEAEKTRNVISTKYGFLNDINGDVITEDLIVKETKADLAKEKINIPSDIDTIIEEDDEVIVDEDDEAEDAEDLVDMMINNTKRLKETGVSGVYQSNATSTTENPKFYTIKDDKFVELQDVVSIGTDGTCKMKDGTTKTLAEAKENVVESSAQDVADYNATIKRIDTLLKSHITKCNTKLNGTTIYKSKGKDEDGHHQFFFVKDNKLVKICGYLDNTGKVHIGEEVKSFVDLTDADVSEVNNDEILAVDYEKIDETENDDSADEEVTVQVAEGDSMERAAQRKGLEATSVTGYYKKGEDFFKYNVEEKTFEKLKDVIGITNVGEIVYKDGVDTTGKPKYATAIATPSSQGKTLRQRLYADSSASDYIVTERIINSFSTYTEPEDIVKFIEGYNDEKSAWSFWNCEMCAQISTENNLSNRKKSEMMQKIAKQILKVMDKLPEYFGKESDEYEDMKYYAYETNVDDVSSWRKSGSFWRSWSFWNSERTGAANRMDDIIEVVMEKYREKYPVS